MTKLTRLLEIVLAKVGMFFKFKLLFADGARTIGASVCVCAVSYTHLTLPTIVSV